MIFSSDCKKIYVKSVLIMYLFVLTSLKNTLVTSFRQGRSTTTSFALRNAPFPMKGKMIDTLAQF